MTLLCFTEHISPRGYCLERFSTLRVIINFAINFNTEGKYKKKNGDEGVADLYIKKYLEVKNDKDLLEFISKNQKEWFDRNIKSPNIEKLTFELLELNKWLN